MMNAIQLHVVGRAAIVDHVQNVLVHFFLGFYLGRNLVGFRSVDARASQQAAAAGNSLLFNKDNLRTVLRGGQGGRQAGQASAYHNDIGVNSFQLFHLARRGLQVFRIAASLLHAFRNSLQDGLGGHGRAAAGINGQRLLFYDGSRNLRDGHIGKASRFGMADNLHAQNLGGRKLCFNRQIPIVALHSGSINAGGIALSQSHGHRCQNHCQAKQQRKQLFHFSSPFANVLSKV